MDVMVIIYAVIAAIIYSLIWYAKTWATTQPPEPFSYTKFAATLVVGAGVGVFFWLTNNPITIDTVSDQLFVYGAVVAVVETILKSILAKLNLKYPGMP